VLRTGVSDRDLAQTKLEVLDHLPIRMLGAVLNDVREGGVYRYYSYYLEGYEAEGRTRRRSRASAAGAGVTPHKDQPCPDPSARARRRPPRAVQRHLGVAQTAANAASAHRLTQSRADLQQLQRRLVGMAEDAPLRQGGVAEFVRAETTYIRRRRRGRRLPRGRPAPRGRRNGAKDPRRPRPAGRASNSSRTLQRWAPRRK